MTRIVAIFLALALLGACGSTGNDGENPLDSEAGEGDGSGGDGSGDDGGEDREPIESDRSLPPGTSDPSARSAIVRYEPLTEEGGGYAEAIRYNSDDDTFEVDGIPFDADNSYDRDDRVPSLGPFAVYESDENATDPVTGNQVSALSYRAIYGVSRTGQTEFAIVRTGSYTDYGFGGFVYQRNDRDAAGNSVSLELPTEGDAAYAGDYAGVRIFDGAGGLEYVTGDASMFIDFKDFNDSRAGVRLFVRDRRLFDINGNDITNDYVTALLAENPDLVVERDDNGNAVLPTVLSKVSPNVADGNGEIVQEVFTRLRMTDGSAQEAAAGTYFAIMSGENASEIVGVLVMEGDEPRADATFQETGGFIVYRQ